jgi:hypothetical protein
MFGRVIEDLKNTITLDDSKFEIIELANKINQIRIDLVHGLTKFTDLKQIEDKAIGAKHLFDNLFNKFEQEHDKFRVTFKDFKKDIDWDYQMEE